MDRPLSSKAFLSVLYTHLLHPYSDLYHLLCLYPAHPYTPFPALCHRLPRQTLCELSRLLPYPTTARLGRFSASCSLPICLCYTLPLLLFSFSLLNLLYLCSLLRWDWRLASDAAIYYTCYVNMLKDWGSLPWALQMCTVVQQVLTAV